MNKYIVATLAKGFACLILSLILWSCAGIETNRTILPQKLQLSDTMLLPFNADKCLLDQRTNTYYILEQTRPNIYFYRNNKQINTIGGFGNDKINFQKLDDIALDPDGNLMVLDEFAKLIRKFNPDGRWIIDIDISSFSQPTRFCSTPEGDFIIYDSATKELTKVSGFDGKAMFTFGRFQVDSVSGITASRDFVAVVSDKKDKTVLFSGIGMLLKDLPEQVVVDRYQNQYGYTNGAVKLLNTEMLLPFGKDNSEVRLCASGLNILLVNGSSISTITPVYNTN
jgi:hypothetical protein